MSDRTAERLARNDATFREANEHIAERAETYGVHGLIPLKVAASVDPRHT